MQAPTGILLTGEYKWYKVLQRFISFLFRSVWLFFPAILFLALTIICFWILAPAKDLIVAFAENEQARIYFFLAIGFWAYMSWYSSRIVAYQKQYKQQERIQKLINEAECTTDKNLRYSFNHELPVYWLEIFPRILGFACFMIIELAILQSSLYRAPGMATGTAWLILGLLVLLYLVFNKKVSAFAFNHKRIMDVLFWGLLILFVLLGALSYTRERDLMNLFWLVLLLHFIYLVYIHRRPKEMENKIARQTKRKMEGKQQRQSVFTRFFYWVMDRLYIPRIESAYFIWFLLICMAGLIVYILAIVYLRISVRIGPFPLVLLAFSVLLGFGNLLTMLSVRLNINFHLIVFLFALFFGSGETHRVRTVKQVKEKEGIYTRRQDVGEYFKNWLLDSARGRAIDESVGPYNVYFVLANGGASRSGYWTSAVLGKLEDSTRGTKGWFSKHLFCLSGASGGSVGNVTFFSLLDSCRKRSDTCSISFVNSATAYLKKDFLSYTLARMLGPDYFKYIFHFTWDDRAGALENALEDVETSPELLHPAMKEPFTNFLGLRGEPYSLPILCLNVTRMQDGHPSIISNIKLDPLNFNNRVDVTELLPVNEDITLSTAAILSSRFPYISPAGRIDQKFSNDSLKPHYFVDGGYFDNSGAGVVQEMIRLINNYGRATKDSIIKRRSAKLRYTVLHITNGGVGTPKLYATDPLTNDLLSPLLTAIGSYDMQTTVNDSRLRNFLRDIDSVGPTKARYYPIHLYKECWEREKDPLTGKCKKESPYSMNWFISDTTRSRMNQRLQSHARLNELIRSMR